MCVCVCVSLKCSKWILLCAPCKSMLCAASHSRHAKQIAEECKTCHYKEINSGSVAKSIRKSIRKSIWESIAVSKIGINYGTKTGIT